MKKLNSVKWCRWAFRLLLMMLALPVAVVGIQLLLNPETLLFGPLFLLAALLLPTAEFFFNYLKLQENKEK